MNYLNALIDYFKKNPASEYFAKRLHDALDSDYIEKLDEKIQRNLERYEGACIKQDPSFASADIEKRIRKAADLFPTFILRLTVDFYKESGSGAIARHLFICDIFSLLSVKEPKYISLLQDIDPRVSLKDLHNRAIGNTGEESYIPKILFNDFIAIAKDDFKHQATSNAAEQIETLFCSYGVSQVIHRFYFDLLSVARSDTIAAHIDSLLSVLFLSMKRHDEVYWASYGENAACRPKLFLSICNRDPDFIHPELHSSYFIELSNHSPFSRDLAADVFTEIEEAMVKRLQKIQTFSSFRLSILLMTVLKTKGRRNVEDLFARLQTKMGFKLRELHQFLHQQESPIFSDLKTVFISWASSGRIGVQKNLSAVQADASKPMPREDDLRKSRKDQLLKQNCKEIRLTQDQISQYLERRLRKLCQRAGKKGALTQANIGAYLKLIAEKAAQAIGPAPLYVNVLDSLAVESFEMLEEIAKETENVEEKIYQCIDDIALRAREIAEASAGAGSSATIQSEAAALSGDGDKSQLDRRDDLLSAEIVPIGFELGAPKISVEDFLKFPLAGADGPQDSDWFSYHKEYLKAAVQRGIMDNETAAQIIDLTQGRPKLKYKRYFDIFQNNSYDDSILTTVYTLYRNNGIDRLVVQ